jgi:hypothetical protein
MDTIEKIVIKGSDTTYILKDSNALPSTNVTQDIDENPTAEQVPSAKAIYQMGGSGGEAAGFGTPEASATQLESTQPPTVTVEASGPNTAKIFKFSFGIPQGAKGEKGDTGAQGPKGDTGATGAAGNDEITPTIGANGNWYIGTEDTGKPSRGEKGDPGAKGDKGDPGVKGDKGDTGATGPQGSKGEPGATGAQGPKGDTGATGAVFTPSVDTSGNISWTNNGGLENPETRNIRGPQGATGDTGAQGPKGDTGPQGPAGSDASVTAANIKSALGYTPADSKDIPTVPTADINANTAARHSHSNKEVLDTITGVVTADKINNPDHVTDLVQYDAFQLASEMIIDKIPSVPAALKNPYSLTVKVNGNSVDYDGSAAKMVEITTGSTGDDTPDYVLTAADALAQKLVGHIAADNIVFAVMADAHLGYYTDTANAAGKQAGQALKRLNERCALDFVTHVGDYSTGAWNTTAADAQEDNADYQLLIGSKYPGRAIWCPGNHDDAPYQATANRLTQTQMYAAIGRKNLVSGGYVPNNACYGYMDFPGLHLRVIYLDTHDHRSWGTIQLGSGVDNPYLNADNISAAQLQYLVDHALNFSGVSDPSQWSILVFSHAALTGSGSYTDPVSGIVHPSNTANAATLLKAYATKQSGSITHGDSTVSYDFSAITPAQIIACIHGHEHRYANETVGGAFLSICCPNIMNGRERASADGNTYTKTAGTANGTSFCVFSINRADKKIYVDHYGPGLDREFTYTVLDPDAPSYTNQLPLATDTDGSVYNGMGYASGQRLNSSGAAEGYNGSYLTGFIPVKFGDVVRLKNVTWQNGVTTGLNSGNQRISFYSADKAHLGQTNAIGLGGTLSGVKDANGIWTQFTVKNFSGVTLDNAAYFRLNCAGLSADSIITVNEEIDAT